MADTNTINQGENTMEPIDQLLGYLTDRIETEQPTEAEMLSAAHERYDPYYQEESDLMREYYGVQMAGTRRSADTRIANARRSYQNTMNYINNSRQNLQQEHSLYMEELRTGKLRAGSDEQKTKERLLQDKARMLEQMQSDQTVKMQNLQRSYISRGGLFSGVRQQAGKRQEEGYQRDVGGVEQQTGRGIEDAQERYQRAMEDYAMKGKQSSANLAGRQGSLSAQASSARGSFEGTQASAQAGITSAQESADYQMKTRQRQLDFDKEQALMDYVYGDRAYDYLDL